MADQNNAPPPAQPSTTSADDANQQPAQNPSAPPGTPAPPNSPGAPTQMRFFQSGQGWADYDPNVPLSQQPMASSWFAGQPAEQPMNYRATFMETATYPPLYPPTPPGVFFQPKSAGQAGFSGSSYEVTPPSPDPASPNGRTFYTSNTTNPDQFQSMSGPLDSPWSSRFGGGSMTPPILNLNAGRFVCSTPVREQALSPPRARFQIGGSTTTLTSPSYDTQAVSFVSSTSLSQWTFSSPSFMNSPQSPRPLMTISTVPAFPTQQRPDNPRLNTTNQSNALVTILE